MHDNAPPCARDKPFSIPTKKPLNMAGNRFMTTNILAESGIPQHGEKPSMRMFTSMCSTRIGNTCPWGGQNLLQDRKITLF
jgi:hypothetical protein